MECSNLNASKSDEVKEENQINFHLQKLINECEDSNLVIDLINKKKRIESITQLDDEWFNGFGLTSKVRNVEFRYKYKIDYIDPFDPDKHPGDPRTEFIVFN